MIAVDTRIGAHTPSFLGKLFGQKPSPGVIVYVCCPACAEKVKRDPAPYAVRVLTDLSASAPAPVATYPPANPPALAPAVGQAPPPPASPNEAGWARR